MKIVIIGTAFATTIWGQKFGDAGHKTVYFWEKKFSLRKIIAGCTVTWVYRRASPDKTGCKL